MPTAIVQLELSDPPSTLRVGESYDRAFVVGRLSGRPVAHAVLSVVDGIVDRESVFDHVAAWLASRSSHHPPGSGTRESAAPRDPPSATVAVCSRDRPDDLRRCLVALARVRGDGCEVIVVDNDAVSPGATAAVAGEFAAVRCVRETRPGLSAARNRAIAESSGDVVCFTDDDAVPEPGWLDALRAPFDDPMVWCVTGLTLPLELETEAQELFERHTSHGRGYEARRFRGAETNPLAIGQVGAGVNMAIRRTAFEQIGAFDPALGAGSPARAGEDYDLFTRILAAGFHIAYEPAAVVWHRHRRDPRDLKSAFYAYSVGVYAYLTRTLLVEREPAAIRYGAKWLFQHQLPALWRALLGDPGALPLSFRTAELRALAVAPALYLAGRIRRRSDR
ncbi:MAG TPA: glycosyltransferase [Gemmatimonadota bacterium]